MATPAAAGAGVAITVRSLLDQHSNGSSISTGYKSIYALPRRITEFCEILGLAYRANRSASSRRKIDTVKGDGTI